MGVGVGVGVAERGSGARVGPGVRRFLGVIVVGLALLVAAGIVKRLDQDVTQRILPEVVRGNGYTDELADALSFHDVQLPSSVADIQYTINSSIDAEVLGISFTTDEGGLQDLLQGIHEHPDDLIDNMNPWEVTLARTSSRYQWDLSRLTDFTGLTVPSSSNGLYRYAVLVVPDGQRVRVYLEAQEL